MAGESARAGSLSKIKNESICLQGNSMWLKGQSERQKEIRNKNRMRKNRWRKILLGVLVLMAAIIATICFVFSPFSPDSTRTVTVGGETYKQKDGITTILLLGIDKRETLEN